MKWIHSAALAAAIGGVTCQAMGAMIESDGPQIDDSTQVAGTRLKLNGAGLGRRFVFTVYSIGLYTPELRSNVEQVLNCDGPRRIAIQMLRDVSGDDFRNAVADASQRAEDPPPSQRVAIDMERLGTVIAHQPLGLRKGDRLTLDWVPGTGAVIELNRKPLIEPIADKAFYDALLNVWLGQHTRDQTLKTRLLGMSPA